MTARAETRPRRTAARRTSRRRAWLGGGAGALVGLVVFAAVPGVQPGAGAAGNPLAGSQGVVTSLPSTSSAVTISGQGAFPGLQVTVNQTQNLVNQAISVSWTGATPTQSATAFQSDYLQIFECWGDPQTQDPVNTADPGPLPTQCQFGAEAPSSGSYPVKEPGSEYSRILSQPTWSTFAALGADPTTWTDPASNYVVEPFQAVDGTTVDKQADYNYNLDPNNPKPFWLNPYFRFGTSNEVDFARTYQDGTGQALFQVQTGLQAPGLGCGQELQHTASGTTTPHCWLVIVPRGSSSAENPSGLTDENVVTSPLAPAAWANRIAIPLGFNPVGSSCSINADAQQIMGSELASSAVASWQPSLCGLAGSPSFSYIQNSDDQARQNLVEPTYGSAGMSVFTDPADPSTIDPSNPVVYSPLTLSGVVVAFNIQRVPALVGGEPQPDEAALAGAQVGHLYLTPRLMAKLLTQSYQAQLQNVTSAKPSGYEWVQKNPTDLLTDPDFLRFNPEFQLLSTTQAADAGTALVEQASSDAAAAVWKWILSDHEAAAWLAGTPDPWGMKVNPLYSTNGSLNPSGAPFGVPAPVSYPKSDPYCTDTHEVVTGPPAAPARPLCILDWSPYSLTMQTAAASTGAANDGAKTTFNGALTPNTAWTANGPQVPGTHFLLSITDSASAAQYGLQTASLSRAGDDTDPASRVFVAPDASGLSAGERAMTPSKVTGVLEGDPTSTAAGAYPLTLFTYAATRPQTLTDAARQQYAQFLLYAIGDGQTSGVEVGQLPPGYVPLPGALRLAALGAVNSILHPPAVATTSSSTTSTSTGDTGSSTFDTSSSTDTGSVGTDTSSSTDTSSTSTSTGGGDIHAPSVRLVKTSLFGVGVTRWALPLVLLLGVGAALGALLLGRPRRPTTPTGGPS